MDEETPENEPKEICGKSFEDLRQIILELDDLSYEMLNHPQIEPLLQVIEKLELWICQARGSHDWILDQCGYWQHSYCVDCKELKYPYMALQRCGELDAQMGKRTEEEYNQKRI